MSELSAVRVRFIAFAYAVRSGPVFWSLLAAPVLALLLGCPNPDYLPNGPGTCVDDRHCSESRPLCDPVTKTCVQCTASDPSTCNEATPICDEAGTCRACRADPECASQVCQLSGNCLPEDQALYVSPAGAGDACTASQPCVLQTALTLFTPQRFAIKLSPGTYRGSISIGDNQRLEIHGDGADLTRNEEGPIFEARGLASLTVLGLRIHGARAESLGHGVVCGFVGGNMPTITFYRVVIDDNRGHGIDAEGCELRLERSVVDRNYSGGIMISGGRFELVNNLIIGNGGYQFSFGGLYLQFLGSARNVLDFNTIAGNRVAQNGYISGVTCGLVFTEPTFSNNIVYSNLEPSGGSDIHGACNWRYSNIEGGWAGEGNLDQDPRFVRLGVDPDFHIAPASPCVDAADPSASVDGDVDGDARPQGAARDIGADEVR